MELVKFKPIPGCDGEVTGYLHSPITEMEVHRTRYPVVVLCPGGAYAMCSQREEDPVALRFFARGYQVFTLIYSVGEKAKDFTPLKELSETFRLIRENADSYHADPDKIAVCGFSAGGHLAGSLGTMWNDPEFLKVYDNHGGQNKPNAMILCYPVITADEFAHVESIENVSGCKQGTPGYGYFSLDKHVSHGGRLRAGGKQPKDALRSADGGGCCRGPFLPPRRPWIVRLHPGDRFPPRLQRPLDGSGSGLAG